MSGRHYVTPVAVYRKSVVMLCVMYLYLHVVIHVIIIYFCLPSEIKKKKINNEI